VIFSYNLVLALFLLAPGFAGFAGLYLASQLGRVKSQPMPPGSVLALALVTVSALAAHAIAASLFWAQRAFCDAFACIHLPVDPDPYAVFLAQGRGLSLAGDAQIALALLNLFGLTVFTFVLARLAGGWLSSLPAMRGLLYGWLADVVPAESRISGDGAAEVFMAYVLSDLEDGGVVVGYEGAVANGAGCSGARSSAPAPYLKSICTEAGSTTSRSSASELVDPPACGGHPSLCPTHGHHAHTRARHTASLPREEGRLEPGTADFHITS
jgi:hypothetical protein